MSREAILQIQELQKARDALEDQQDLALQAGLNRYLTKTAMVVGLLHL